MQVTIARGDRRKAHLKKLSTLRATEEKNISTLCLYNDSVPLWWDCGDRGLKQLNMIKSSDLFIIKRSELKILFSKSIPNLHYLLFKQHIFFSSYRVGESFLLYWETLFLAKGPHSVRSDWSSSTDWMLDLVGIYRKDNRRHPKSERQGERNLFHCDGRERTREKYYNIFNPKINKKSFKNI